MSEGSTVSLAMVLVSGQFSNRQLPKGISLTDSSSTDSSQKDSSSNWHFPECTFPRLVVLRLIFPETDISPNEKVIGMGY